jgi:molecular chaperone GrpE
MCEELMTKKDKDTCDEEIPNDEEIGNVEATKEDPIEALEEEIIKLNKELEEKTKEAKENNDNFLRSRADLENYKKRVEKEKKEIREFANDNLIMDLLTVVDNMERALSHINDESNVKSLKEGVDITVNQMITLLNQFGLEQISAVGESFDPKVHEALSHEESADHEPDTVIREMRKGYTLKGRLLRPSIVTVSKSVEDTKR